MTSKDILQFDECGRLYINHICELCIMYPLENINDPCLQCGYSQLELICLEGKVDRANKAIDLIAPSLTVEVGEVIEVREAFLKVEAVHLGGGELDTMVLVDLDQSDAIRKIAHLADHMVKIIIYPTNIRNIEFELDMDDVEFI